MYLRSDEFEHQYNSITKGEKVNRQLPQTHFGGDLQMEWVLLWGTTFSFPAHLAPTDSCEREVL